MIVQGRNGRRTEVDMMECNHCRKRISIVGLDLMEVEAGEFQIKFFECPYCGKRYQVLTSDEEQRKTTEEQRRLTREIEIMIRKKFRKKKVDEVRRRLQALTDELRERQKTYLGKIGTLILDGEDPETAKKALETVERTKGAENGQKAGD